MDVETKVSGGWVYPTGYGRVLLAPDPAGGGGGGVTTQTQTPPAEETLEGANDRPDFNVPSASEPGGGGTAGGGGASGGGGGTRTQAADPNLGAGGTRTQTQTPPAAEGNWQSVMDAARSLGYQPDASITDDHAFLVHLIGQANAARQSNYYADLGRSIVPHANLVQQAITQARQPAPQERPSWEAPEFDQRWLHLVTRDEATGLFTNKPGAPDVASKLNAYVAWKDQYDRNPAAVLNPMIDQRAKSIAETIVKEQVQQIRQQTVMDQITQANAGWLFAVDAQGHRVQNAQGKYVPSPIGVKYMQALRTLSSAGVTDPVQADTLAKRLIAGEIQQTRTTPADPQTQQATHRPQVNPNQAAGPVTRAKNPAATDPSTEGLSLSEMLRNEFRSEGVTDADLAASFGQ